MKLFSGSAIICDFRSDIIINILNKELNTELYL